MPGPTRILVIDDNPAVHEEFQRVFASAERSNVPAPAAEVKDAASAPATAAPETFEVTSLFQGEEGVKAAQLALTEGRPFVVAFVDMRMPEGWDGIDTIRELWKLQPDLQTVLCSGYADFSWEEFATRLVRYHQCLVLQKPFERIEVLQLAHALSEKRTWARQLEQAPRPEPGPGIGREQRMDALGQLATGVATEFDQLLTAVQAYTEVAASGRKNKQTKQAFEKLVQTQEQSEAVRQTLLATTREQVLNPAAPDLNRDTFAQLVKQCLAP